MALDAFKMRLVAKALMVLREKTVAIRLVNQDFQMAAASKNEVISIPDSVAQTVHDVAPSQAFPAKAEVDPANLLLRLDQWKETYFDAVDKDEVEANLGWFLRQTEASIEGPRQRHGCVCASSIRTVVFIRHRHAGHHAVRYQWR